MKERFKIVPAPYELPFNQHVPSYRAGPNGWFWLTRNSKWAGLIYNSSSSSIGYTLRLKLNIVCTQGFHFEKESVCINKSCTTSSWKLEFKNVKWFFRKSNSKFQFFTKSLFVPAISIQKCFLIFFKTYQKANATLG